MAKLMIRVRGGATEVTVDGDVVTALTHLIAYCEGNNRNDDTIKLKYQGIVQGTNICEIVCAEGQIELTIPDSLGELLRGI